MSAVLVLEIWLVVLLFRHTELHGDVWWRFALSGQNPRALRAAVAGAVIILVFGAVRLLRGNGSQQAPGADRDTLNRERAAGAGRRRG